MKTRILQAHIYIAIPDYQPPITLAGYDVGEFNLYYGAIRGKVIGVHVAMHIPDEQAGIKFIMR